MKKVLLLMLALTILSANTFFIASVSGNSDEQQQTVAGLLYSSPDAVKSVTLRKVENDRIVTKTVVDDGFYLSIGKIALSQAKKSTSMDMKGMYIEVLKKDGDTSFLYITENGEIDVYNIYMGRTPFAQYTINDVTAANRLLNGIWDLAAKVPDNTDENVKHLSINANEIKYMETKSLPRADVFKLYTDSKQYISAMVKYLNGLDLTADNTDTSSSAGMALDIELTLNDGTINKYMHYGNTWFWDNEGTQYRMKYEQASTLEALIITMRQEINNVNEDTQTLFSDWAAQDIKMAVDIGIMPDSTENFTQNIGREQFCELAYNLIVKVTGKTFEDVVNPYSDTNSHAVACLHSLGIIMGYEDGTFGPDRTISREEVAVLLYRIANYLGVDGFLPDYKLSSYCYADDAGIGGWAKEAVYQLQYGGILKGVGNDLFAPQDSFAKEQTVAALIRIYHQVPESEIGTKEPTPILEPAPKEYDGTLEPDVKDKINQSMKKASKDSFTNRIFVNIKDNVDKESLIKKISPDAIRVKDISVTGSVLLEYKTIDEAIESVYLFNANDNVNYAEPVYKMNAMPGGAKTTSVGSE